MLPEIPALPGLTTAETFRQETKLPIYNPRSKELVALGGALKAYENSSQAFAESRTAYQERPSEATLREAVERYDRAAEDFDHADGCFTAVERTFDTWNSQHPNSSRNIERDGNPGPVTRLQGEIAAGRTAIDNGRVNFAMKVFTEGTLQEGRVTIQTRDFERTNPAFWARFNGADVTAAVDGRPLDSNEAGSSLGERLKDYVTQQKEAGAKSVTIEYGKKPREQALDWSNFSRGEPASVAIYIPQQRQATVDELIGDLSEKIEIATAKGVDCFVAPEYAFTKHQDGIQTALSKAEHEQVCASLREIAKQHPDTVIVAGTSLWVTDENKLRDTALILGQGKLSQYDKASLPFGDKLYGDALTHHLNESAPARSARSTPYVTGALTPEMISRNSSFGDKPYFDIIQTSKYRVAICSDIVSQRTDNRKDFDIELIPAHALGQIQARDHHVHQGGHVFIADGMDGAARFVGSESQQKKLAGGENGLHFHNFEVRKPVQQLGHDERSRPQQRSDHLALGAQGSSAGQPPRRSDSPPRPAHTASRSSSRERGRGGI